MSVDLNSPEARRALTKMMIKLFDLWGLEDGDRLVLLGLDPADTNLLGRLRNGEAELPETGETPDRVGWLLTVHKALRIAYP